MCVVITRIVVIVVRVCLRVLFHFIMYCLVCVFCLCVCSLFVVCVCVCLCLLGLSCLFYVCCFGVLDVVGVWC